MEVGGQSWGEREPAESDEGRFGPARRVARGVGLRASAGSHRRRRGLRAAVPPPRRVYGPNTAGQTNDTVGVG